MKAKKLNRFSELVFKNGKRLRNRVVVPPMASETADEQGFVTNETLRHYQDLGLSKAGLIMVEYSYVHISGRSEEKQLGIHSDAYISGLSEIARTIHHSGALAGIQITHAGGKTSRDLTGGVLMGTSSIAVPVKDRTMEVPDEMTESEILLWKDAFLSAVKRASIAGFDLVEFHAAHGYGLNQWLSPITNKRCDSFGGSRAANAKLLLEIVKEARKAHPEMLFAVRMPGQDFMEGGLTQNDATWIAKRLELAGLDLIDVSSGIGGWRRPKERRGEGYLVDEATVIQAAVSIPVIGVGGIESGCFIDRVIQSGKISLAAVGRAILKDPGQWGKESFKCF